MKSKIELTRYIPIKGKFTLVEEVEEEKGKCLIIFPMLYIDGKVFWGANLGLVAILFKYNIIFNNVYIRPSKIYFDKYYDSGEVVFEFDKKHTNKIRSVEKAYFEHKISIDAWEMSSLLMFIIDNLKTWQERLISECKSIPQKGKKKNKLSKK